MIASEYRSLSLTLVECNRKADSPCGAEEGSLLAESQLIIRIEPLL